MATKFYPSSSDLHKVLVELLRSNYRQSYIFASKQHNGYGVVIKQQTGRKERDWKRYVLTLSQMESFDYLASCINVPVYYFQKKRYGGKVNVNIM